MSSVKSIFPCIHLSIYQDYDYAARGPHELQYKKEYGIRPDHLPTLQQ